MPGRRHISGSIHVLVTENFDGSTFFDPNEPVPLSTTISYKEHHLQLDFFSENDGESTLEKLFEEALAEAMRRREDGAAV